jgi:hypothetical protein
LESPSDGGGRIYAEMKLAMDAIQAYHQGQRFMKKLVQRYRFDF